MITGNPTFYKYIVLFSLTALVAVTGYSSPQLDSIKQKIEYTDFMPKYRQPTSVFLISKVDYTTEKIILHFRYVSEQTNDQIRFFGTSKSNAWVLSTPKRPGATPIRYQGAIKNVRVNNQPKHQQLKTSDEIGLKLEKGDIVSCEIHFNSMPHYIRVVNLEGGDVDKSNTRRFECYDLMLKSINSPILGNKNQMETNIKRFYDKFKYVRYPDLIEFTSLEQEVAFQQQKEEAKKRKSETPIQGSMESINYMPKLLTSMDELECRERVILKNVYFEEEKTDFSKRTQATKTLGIILDYLRRYPDSRIILHGHTDIFGDAYRNLILSKERVLSIKRWFTLKNIDKKRIIPLYHGGAQPLPLYKNGGSMNRRIEIEVICNDTHK
ncbi:MAG: OmpA family protein [Saprospiraceae bacterium]|nr:OmpA family protein [Saprospiraceae bacterium]